MLCSFVSGIEVKHSEAFGRVAECIYICTHADNTEENISVDEVICDAHKVRTRSNLPSDFVFKAVYFNFCP